MASISSAQTTHGTLAWPRLALPPGLAVVLPNGQRLGDDAASVTIELPDAAALRAAALNLRLGRIGAIASAYVEGRVRLCGSPRAVCEIAASLLPNDPVAAPVGPLRAAWQTACRQAWSWWRRRPGADARQIQFHYNVNNEFYALWLDPKRVYSCAYWPAGCDTLAQAQEAKLDLICRKQQVTPGLRLLAPGGLLLNHGITAASTDHFSLGAGLGDFVERYIFPGGEILHLANAIEAAANAGLETLDVENLRPHYARTLWAWSDALERQLDAAAQRVPEATLRAYRLYLAGCAMAFERGWLQLHQMLMAKPSGRLDTAGVPRGAQSAYPFTHNHMLTP